MTRAQLTFREHVATERQGLLSLWIAETCRKHRRALRLAAQAKAQEKRREHKGTTH